MKNKLKVMFKCKYCGVIISTAEKFIQHKRNKHSSNLVPRTVTPSLRDDAKMTTNSSAAESSQAESGTDQEEVSYNKIRRTEKVTKPNRHIFKCRVCDQCFDNKEDLDCHLEFHTEETHYSCRSCYKEFVKWSDLLLHEEHCPSGSGKRTDSVPQNNDFVEEYRNRSSTSSREASLRVKLNDVHEYECRFCKKRFGFAKALKLHLRRHSEEIPYCCKFCNMKFSEASSMERHLKMCAHNVNRRNSVHLLKSPTFKIDPLQHKRINSKIIDTGRRHETVFQFKPHGVRPESRKSISETSAPDNLHNCAYCGSNFSHSSHVEQHQKICFARFDASQGLSMLRPEFSRSLHETVGTSRSTVSPLPSTSYHRQPKSDWDQPRPQTITNMFRPELSRSLHETVGTSRSTVSPLPSTSYHNQPKSDWDQPRPQTITNKTERASSSKFCNQEFQSQLDVKIHERIQTGEKPYSFNVRNRKSCTSSFKSFNKSCKVPEGLEKKRGNLSGEQNHKENVKQEADNRKGSAKVSNHSKPPSNTHIKAEMLDGKLQCTCSSCGKTFASVKQCRLHVLAHDLRTYRCHQCHTNFRNPVSVRHHMSKCKTPLPVKIEAGSLKNSARSSVEIKLSVPHPEGSVKVKEELEDEDKRGGETYRPQRYVPHVNQVHRNSQLLGYSCEICKKVLRQAVTMREHMRAHVGPNIYKCPQCEQTFKGFLDVQRHQKVHAVMEDINSRESRKVGRPSKSIPEFDVNFTEKIIQGTTWFECNFCNLKSLYRSYLRRHITAHTGTYPHCCSICNEGFHSARALEKHVKKHNLGQQCSKCPLQFSTKDDLRKHQAGHVGTKPLLCMKCGEWFQFTDQLRHHMAHEHQHDNVITI